MREPKAKAKPQRAKPGKPRPTRRQLALRRTAANRYRRRNGITPKPELARGSCETCNGWGGPLDNRCRNCGGKG